MVEKNTRDLAEQYADLFERIDELETKHELSMYDDKVMALVEEIDAAELALVLRELLKR